MPKIASNSKSVTSCPTLHLCACTWACTSSHGINPKPEISADPLLSCPPSTDLRLPRNAGGVASGSQTRCQLPQMGSAWSVATAELAPNTPLVRRWPIITLLILIDSCLVIRKSCDLYSGITTMPTSRPTIACTETVAIQPRASIVVLPTVAEAVPISMDRNLRSGSLQVVSVEAMTAAKQ
ncbi:hypothetical protein H4582DRAFT_2012756 [Lactarius indigo]|nr:hypothetical protein H4582DRAFT_2012756 [Lactarius indigo]